MELRCGLTSLSVKLLVLQPASAHLALDHHSVPTAIAMVTVTSYSIAILAFLIRNRRYAH
jgi:hypothetical protein